MGVVLTLYKPVKTTYIPGKIDIMSPEELENTDLTDNIDGSYSDGKQHYKFYIWNHMTGPTKRDRRNRYAKRCIDELLNRYHGITIDTYEWLKPNINKNIDKYLHRYFVPTDIILETKIEAVHSFYNRTNTIRYAFNKKDAVRIAREFIQPSQNKSKIIRQIDESWEDGMFLVISW